METRISSEMARNFTGIQSLKDTSQVAVQPQEEMARRAEDGQEESSSRDMNAMVEEVREMARMFERDLEFRIEEELDRPVVEVKDTQRDEVIRQIPSEQMVELAKNMERIRGILFDETT